MNKHHARGHATELKGRIKEEVGRVTRDNSTQAEGLAEQVKGRVQQKLGDLKDLFKRGAQRFFESERHAMNKLSQKINEEDGRLAGYVLAWLLGVPISVLLVVFLIFGR